MKILSDDFACISRPGAPGVITRSILIEIPPDCDIDLHARSLTNKIIPDLPLAPSPKRIINKGENNNPIIDEKYIIDQEIYSSNDLFPGKLAEIEFVGFLRDKRVAKINLFPVQYNPADNVLEIHKKLKVNIDFKYKASSKNVIPAKAGIHKMMKLLDSRCNLSRLYRGGSDKWGIIRGFHNSFNTQVQVNSFNKFKDRIKKTAFESVYRSCLLNYSEDEVHDIQVHSGGIISSVDDAVTEISESPFAVKVVIDEEGFYRITYEDLDALGIDLSYATNENLKMQNRGAEIAVYCSGSGSFKLGDYIIFYGEPFKSLYSKKNVYWLFLSKDNGKRMSEINGNPVSDYPLKTAFNNVLHEEEDIEYWLNIPPYEEGIDHWFWKKLSINDSVVWRDFTVYLKNLDKSLENYSMKLNLRGETNTSQNPDHHTKVYVNGNIIDDFMWEGQAEITRVMENVSSYFFTEGSNRITIEAVDDMGSTVDSYYINWFEIAYSSLFQAENDCLKFRSDAEQGAMFKIEGFSSSNVWSFNITDPQNVKIITDSVIAQNGSDYTVSFEDEINGSQTYYAIGENEIKSPSLLIVDDKSELSAERDGVDYIIITNKKFYDRIQELKSYRESRGLKVEVVEIQDIYDEFSYGIKDAGAIKSFLKHAYDNWNKKDHPTYVLLVGDASLDYRDDKGNYALGKEDYVPTYIYQTGIIGDTPTDNWFVCVNGSDYLPDMFVGRLCVKTDDDLINIIDKIKKYEKADPSAWNSNVILAADDDSMFENISENLGAIIPEGFYTKKLYVSHYKDINSATDDLINMINEGAVITNYTGHGHIDEWSSDYLFQTPDDREGGERNDVNRLTNENKLTFVVALNCLNGFFAHWDDDYSLAEEFVRSGNKGAVACLASTNSGYPSEHQILAKNIFTSFFHDKNKILGSLITAAKINAYSEISSRDIVETFTLFGDPATELKYATDTSAGAFQLLYPSDNETLSKILPATFTWSEGMFHIFKVQYSSNNIFSKDKTLTVPLFSFSNIPSGSYTPDIFVWSVLKIMNSRYDKLFWRVLAYDENNNLIDESDYRSFSIAK